MNGLPNGRAEAHASITRLVVFLTILFLVLLAITVLAAWLASRLRDQFPLVQSVAVLDASQTVDRGGAIMSVEADGLWAIKIAD